MKIFTTINEFKHRLNESIPFERDIKDVFPDIDSDELARMFYGSNYEDRETIIETIKDDVIWMCQELESEGIDYTKLSQTEFIEEFSKRNAFSVSGEVDLYKLFFKEYITDPNQLELKFESIKEFYGGASKGQIEWEKPRLEQSIKKFIKFGLSKNQILSIVDDLFEKNS